MIHNGIVKTLIHWGIDAAKHLQQRELSSYARGECSTTIESYSSYEPNDICNVIIRWYPMDIKASRVGP